jgi:hypothetical protein
VFAQEIQMTRQDSRDATTARIPVALLLGGFLLAGCASASPPLTDSEKDAIVEAMIRVSNDVITPYDRAGCEAAVDRNFSGREPALTWSVAGQGTAGVYSFRTRADLEATCSDTPRPAAEREIEQLDAHVLSRHHAYIVMTVVGRAEAPDGQRLQTRFVITNVFERIGEDWKIARHHAAVTEEVSAGSPEAKGASR